MNVSASVLKSIHSYFLETESWKNI